MDERKSVYTVIDDEQMSRVRGALEDVTSLVDSLRLGCEIAYLREPTQAEGDAHEYRNDQSMGASYGANECFVPMGGHHGWKCNCGTWVWGGPTVCQRCVDREAVKVALEWKGELERMRAFVRRTATDGGSIVSSASMTPAQIAIARNADRMFVTPDGLGFVYVPGPMFCACGRVESDCDQSRASCPKVDPASEGDDETDIIIAGRQVPFVQVGMIVHPDDCLNCERDGSPLWCSALVCDIHDDDETARFGMMATLLFRNGERREEPCDELRRRWRLARDFDQGRVYTGRWGAIPRGSVWPVAEVNEDA